MPSSYILRHGDELKALQADTAKDARTYADAICTLDRATSDDLIAAMQAGATVVDLRKPDKPPKKARAPRKPKAEAASVVVPAAANPLDMPGERPVAAAA